MRVGGKDVRVPSRHPSSARRWLGTERRRNSIEEGRALIGDLVGTSLMMQVKVLVKHGLRIPDDILINGLGLAVRVLSAFEARPRRLLITPLLRWELEIVRRLDNF